MAKRIYDHLNHRYFIFGRWVNAELIPERPRGFTFYIWQWHIMVLQWAQYAISWGRIFRIKKASVATIPASNKEQA